MMRLARLLTIGALVAGALTASAEARPHDWDRGHGHNYRRGDGHAYGYGHGMRGPGHRVCRTEWRHHRRATRCFRR